MENGGENNEMRKRKKNTKGRKENTDEERGKLRKGEPKKKENKERGLK